jgi:hypothetical protein
MESVQVLVIVVVIADKRQDQVSLSLLDMFDNPILEYDTRDRWLGSQYGIVEILIAAMAVVVAVEVYTADPAVVRMRLSHQGPGKPIRTVRAYERREQCQRRPPSVSRQEPRLPL